MNPTKESGATPQGIVAADANDLVNYARRVHNEAIAISQHIANRPDCVYGLHGLHEILARLKTLHKDLTAL